MMEACQPHLNGSISKTVNISNSSTVEDVMGIYHDSYKMGLKAVAIYRDGSKALQPLNIKKEDKKEVETEEDALTAANMGVDVIMLDNFSAEKAEKISRKIKNINRDILIEISGGITPENIESYAAFADRISLGYLTHSVKNIDFSLEIF